MYNQELRGSELELPQLTLLMSLDLTGETTQKALGRLLAMDSTTLTRTLRVLWNATGSPPPQVKTGGRSY
jgi:DNA-binding MarR family transcriptional regulator